MVNKTQKALKMAIEQIKWADHLHDWHDGLYEALEACKEALAELPAQEPVGEVWWHEGQCNVSIYPTSSMPKEGAKLYILPPKREWRGLSDDEVQTVFELGHKTYREFAKAIEAKLKELNV